jgi:hypothetical protein
MRDSIPKPSLASLIMPKHRLFLITRPDRIEALSACLTK